MAGKESWTDEGKVVVTLPGVIAAAMVGIISFWAGLIFRR